MVCPNVKHWLVIAKRPWRRCFSILRTIVIGKTLTWWTLEVLRLMLDQFCEGHEVNSWRPGTISKVALKANEGRWSDSVIFSFFFRTGSSWDGCLLKRSQDIFKNGLEHHVSESWCYCFHEVWIFSMCGGSFGNVMVVRLLSLWDQTFCKHSLPLLSSKLLHK